MKAEELVIGGKYVPHSKSQGCRFENSDFVLKSLPYLYYRGRSGPFWMFTPDMDVNFIDYCEYYNPEDVTPYVEPAREIKVGDVLTKELLDEYTQKGGQLYYSSKDEWRCDEEGYWDCSREVLVIDSIKGRKFIKVSGTTQHLRIDYNFLLKVMNEQTQQTQTQTNIMKKNTITRAGLKELNEIACNDWRNTIRDLINDKPFEEEFEVDDKLLTLAYTEANDNQRAVLNKYFTKPVVFDSSMLKVGEMMKIEEGNYQREIILRVYDELVSLTDPDHIWGLSTRLRGTKLPAGTKVEIVSK